MRRTVPALAARIVALAALTLAVACHATIDVPVSAETTVKAGNLFQTLLARSFGDFSSIDLSSTSQFKNAGIGKDDVESVRLTSLALRVKAPSGGTLEFLDDVAFFVEAEGLPKLKVAELRGIPNDATAAVLTPTGAELAPYVTAPSMALTTEATAHAPSRDTTLEAAAVFSVDPKVF